MMDIKQLKEFIVVNVLGKSIVVSFAQPKNAFAPIVTKELLKLTDKISYADIFKFPTISKLVEKMSSTDTDYNITYVKDNFVKYENVLNNTMKMPF